MAATVFLLGELARRVGGAVRGDPARPIRGVATLERAGPDELSFLTHIRYRKAARATRAGAVVAPPDSELVGHDLLEVTEPQLALIELLTLFHPPLPSRPGVSPDARLGPGVRLGRDVHIGPFAVVGGGTVLGDGVVIGAACVLGEGCSLGEQTELKPHVVLYPGTSLGQRCLVHAGVVLGGDGFGFAVQAGRHRKVPQVGRLVVEDDVEIGANTTADRAAVGETRIGRGTKIDNLVMIAHGVELGSDCLLAGQSGVAGSSRIGAGATLAGQSGVAGHLQLGDGVRVAAKSAVLRDLPAEAFVAGTPAIDHRRWKRAQAALVMLPELRRELRELRGRIAELERRQETWSNG